jgi:hypothetical protein
LRNLRSRLVFAFFAGMAGFAGVGCNAAWGSAWLLPSGYGQLIAYTAFSESTLAFDAHGNLVAVPAYQKFEVGNYLEYGLTDWLTVIAAPAYDRVSTPHQGNPTRALAREKSRPRSDFTARIPLSSPFKRACGRPVRHSIRLGHWKSAAPRPSICAAWPGAIAVSPKWRVSSRRREAIASMPKSNRANGVSI